MKIAVDLTPLQFDGQVGGAMPFSLELTKALATQPGVKLVVLTAAWNDRELRQFFSCDSMEFINTSGISQIQHGTLRCLSSLWNRIWRRIRGLRLLSGANVDLLFCPLSALSFWMPGIPAISVILDIQHEFYPHFFTKAELENRKAFYRKICLRAHSIICISEYTRKTFIERFKFPTEKSYVAHIGIQERLSSHDDAETTKEIRRLNLQGRVYAYYPANFWPHKNHEMLIAAFSNFCKHHEHYDLHLVLSGNSLDAYDDLMLTIHRMGISDRVHSLGYVSELTVTALYRNCRFLIFPSLFEGFGIPILEAMQFGKPVLCSNTTSLPEIAGEAALYFDPQLPDEIELAMYRILSDDALYLELQTKGLQQAKKYTIEAMVQQYIQVFRATVKTKE